MVWQAYVKINNIPTLMHFEAKNYVIAKGYFEKFGKVVSTITIC